MPDGDDNGSRNRTGNGSRNGSRNRTGNGRAVRGLPPHIAAALAGAGGETDSANQPWAGRDLGPERQSVADSANDDGTADAAYRRAAEELAAGTGSEAEVVATLAAARLFVPIVAEVAEQAPGAHGLPTDKESDMALVTLQAPDGRRALPAFSSVKYLHEWHPHSRPVAVSAPRAALSAAAEHAELVVVDPGAPQTFVLRRPAVHALAQQLSWTPSYLDEEVAALVGEAAAGQQAIRGVEISPGGGVASRLRDGHAVPGGGAGPELRITLQLAAGLDRQAVQTVAAALQQALSKSVRFVDRVDSLELKITSVPD